MSTNFNRRRGAKANQPRNPRRCVALMIRDPETSEVLGRCIQTVPASLNGNRCEDHRLTVQDIDRVVDSIFAGEVRFAE